MSDQKPTDLGERYRQEAAQLRERAKGLGLEALQSVVQGLCRDSRRAAARYETLKAQADAANREYYYHRDLLRAGSDLWTERVIGAEEDTP